MSKPEPIEVTIRVTVRAPAPEPEPETAPAPEGPCADDEWTPHQEGCWVCEFFISRSVTEASMSARGRWVQLQSHPANPEGMLIGGSQP